MWSDISPSKSMTSYAVVSILTPNNPTRQIVCKDNRQMADGVHTSSKTSIHDTPHRDVHDVHDVHGVRHYYSLSSRSTKDHVLNHNYLISYVFVLNVCHFLSIASYSLH